MKGQESIHRGRDSLGLYLTIKEAVVVISCRWPFVQTIVGTARIQHIDIRITRERQAQQKGNPKEHGSSTKTKTERSCAIFPRNAATLNEVRFSLLFATILATRNHRCTVTPLQQHTTQVFFFRSGAFLCEAEPGTPMASLPRLSRHKSLLSACDTAPRQLQQTFFCIFFSHVALRVAGKKLHRVTEP